MKSTLVKHLCIVAAMIAFSGISSADLLLNDTWADGSRAETNLPNESAVWAGDSDIAVSTGSLQYGIAGYTDSHKLWTYFTPDGSPVSLDVGQQLIARIRFTPRGLYESDAENFRFGLFHDPTDPQVYADTDDDGGGSGDPWTDSTGYAVRLALSSGAGDNPQVGKRIDQANNSLLGSSGAYQWDSGGTDIANMTDGASYIASLVLDRMAADQMLVTFTLTDDAGGVLTTHSLADYDGLGDDPIWTQFDHLFFRFSSASGTADVIDFQNFMVEVVPEPATLGLLAFGGLLALRRRRN
ncbi:MAG: PEP-CTERM sorting domain-containing protein [Sedimentisphaerales bacterium]|nr:PEP-CTERM sorting domain-containing protein [Sedimentisphaerales bacterium]